MEKHFEFGKNWERYLKKYFSEERLEHSQEHLLGFLELENLSGKTFLDIGCGSGLHSFAALRSGAVRVVSFDYDADAVRTAQMLWEYAGRPDSWVILQGSVLDKHFLNTLERADIVYSWGVLHHTGDMWRAMDNILPLATDDGVYYIALYDYDVQVDPPAEFWLEVKKRYNQSGWWGRKKMEWWYIWRFMLYGYLSRIPDLIKRNREYKKSRGMALYTDVVDWLGGWPMEFAKRADVKKWAERNNLEIVKANMGEANTEWLFRRRSVR